MSAVLALFASPRGDAAEATEFLRVLAALRAVGREVRLVEIAGGVGVLSGTDRSLEPDGERYLEALADDGVAPAAAPDLAGEVATAATILVLGDGARAGTPPFLRLTRGERPSREAMASLLAAGQVALG